MKITKNFTARHIVSQLVIFGVICFIAVMFTSSYKYALTFQIALITAYLIVLAVYVFRYIFIKLALKHRPDELVNAANQIPEYAPAFASVENDNNISGSTNCLNELSNRDRQKTNLISGKDWRYYDFSYNIYYKTKYGEYVGQTVYYSLLELDLPRALPDILFDTKKAHGRQFRFKFDNSQRQSLEGNFDKYFTTYFPKYYTIDSLSIITPEVMQSMIDSANYDIEISGNKLYLFGALQPAKDIATMLQKGQAIRQTLLNNIKTYRDERLPASIGRQGVTTYGMQLRRNPWAGMSIIITGIVVAVAGIYIFSPYGYKNPSGIFYYGIILSCSGIYQVANATFRNHRLDLAYEKYVEQSKIPRKRISTRRFR